MEMVAGRPPRRFQSGDTRQSAYRCCQALSFSVGLEPFQSQAILIWKWLRGPLFRLSKFHTQRALGPSLHIHTAAHEVVKSPKTEYGWCVPGIICWFVGLHYKLGAPLSPQCVYVGFSETAGCSVTGLLMSSTWQRANLRTETFYHVCIYDVIGMDSSVTSIQKTLITYVLWFDRCSNILACSVRMSMYAHTHRITAGPIPMQVFYYW